MELSTTKSFLVTKDIFYNGNLVFRNGNIYFLELLDGNYFYYCYELGLFKLEDNTVNEMEMLF